MLKTIRGLDRTQERENSAWSGGKKDHASIVQPMVSESYFFSKNQFNQILTKLFILQTVGKT